MEMKQVETIEETFDRDYMVDDIVLKDTSEEELLELIEEYIQEEYLKQGQNKENEITNSEDSPTERARERVKDVEEEKNSIETSPPTNDDDDDTEKNTNHRRPSGTPAEKRNGNTDPNKSNNARSNDDNYNGDDATYQSRGNDNVIIEDKDHTLIQVEFDDDFLYDTVNKYVDDYNLDDDYLTSRPTDNDINNQEVDTDQGNDNQDDDLSSIPNNGDSMYDNIRICSHVHTCKSCDNTGKQIPPCFCYLILYDPATNPDYLTYVHAPRKKISSEKAGNRL